VRLADNPDDEDPKREPAKVEGDVDHAAAELRGLTDAELAEIRTEQENTSNILRIELTRWAAFSTIR